MAGSIKIRSYEVDGQVTVKKVYREGEQVRLQPANPEMLPLMVPAEEVRILGVYHAAPFRGGEGGAGGL